jgi:ribosomal protein S18 acetylase RimI-like enzyme
VLEIAVDAATERDRPLLYELAREAFGEMPGWSDGRVLDCLCEDVVFVARDHDHINGYVALRSGPEEVVIEQVLVSGPESEAVGRRLIDHAEGYAIAVRARALQVVVEPTNRTARSLYRDLGFTELEGELLELPLPQLL